jgi:preprotein translocase subunit SecG
MYTFIIVLILIACVLMILTVLAQSPKSGMAANFGASNAVMGVRQTADFLEKFTWGLAIAIVALSLAATMSISRDSVDASKSALENQIQQSVDGGSQSFELPALPEPPAEPANEQPATEQPTEEAE